MRTLARPQDLRLRLDDYRRLQERLPKYVGTLQAESAWVQQATAGDVSNFATREHLASYAFLRVEPDGRVWHGWSNAPAELGDLRTPLPTIVARYLTTPATEPQVLRLRDPAALRSLADRFGEGASERRLLRSLHRRRLGGKISARACRHGAFVNMTEPLRNAGILFSWYRAPCSCRCDHCLLSAGTQPTSVPYDQAKAVVARYLEWKEQAPRKTLTVGFAAGYSLDFPQLLDYVAFCVRNGMLEEGFLPVGGIRKRRGTELRYFLETLSQAGIRRLGVSFHGVGKSHDSVTHRKGGFEFLLELTRHAAELGLGRHETIFLRKSTLGEIPQLLATLDALGTPEARCLTPFDHRGRGKSLEFERPTSPDLKEVPECAIGFLDARKYRPENTWLTDITSGSIPQHTRRYYLVPISLHNVRELQTESPEVILSLFAQNSRGLQRADSTPEIAGGSIWRAG